MKKIKKLFSKELIDYDGNFLNEYFKVVKSLIYNNTYMIILLAISFLTYGFSFYFHATGVDDLDSERFFGSYGLFRQGRFTGQILHELFDIMNNNVFFTMVVTIILFIIAAILTSAFLKLITGIRSYLILAILASLMIAFPSNAMIFKYILASCLTTLGYLMSILAVIYTIEYALNRKARYFFVVLILLVLLISSYESFVFVYFMIILFITLFNYRKSSVFKINNTVLFILYSAIMIVIAVVIESIIAGELINIFGLEKLDRVSLSNSAWFTSESILFNFKQLVVGIFMKYYFIGLFDFAHLYFVLITFIAIAVMIFSKNTKSIWKSLLIFLIINITLFGISFVDGRAQIDRTMQTFSIFVMFTSAYIYLNLDKKIGKRVLLVTMIYAVYCSSHLQNEFYRKEWKQHLEQERFINTVMYDIESEYGTEQEVYFVGKYNSQERTYDNAVIQIEKNSWKGKLFDKLDNRYYENFHENENSSYYSYAYYPVRSYIDTFGKIDITEYKQEYLVKYANYLGYEVSSCDIDYMTAEEEKKFIKEMNEYPQNGYIKKQNGCIYVNIGYY